MSEAPTNDPLHGVTLTAIVEDLVERHGWTELAARLNLGCFKSNPSVSSSLKFLRATDWARTKVERLYANDHRVIERNAKRNRRRKAQRVFRAEQEAAAKKTGEDQASQLRLDDGA